MGGGRGSGRWGFRGKGERSGVALEKNPCGGKWTVFGKES